MLPIFVFYSKSPISSIYTPSNLSNFIQIHISCCNAIKIPVSMVFEDLI